MRQFLRGCRHRQAVSAKAIPLLGDMATLLRHYLFLYILDMNITLWFGEISHTNGGIA